MVNAVQRGDIGLDRVATDRVAASRGTTSLSLVIILLLPARYLENRSLGAFILAADRSTGKRPIRLRAASSPLHLVNKIPFDRAPLSDPVSRSSFTVKLFTIHAATNFTLTTHVLFLLPDTSNRRAVRATPPICTAKPIPLCIKRFYAPFDDICV